MNHNSFISTIRTGSAPTVIALFFFMTSMTGCAVFRTPGEPEPVAETATEQDPEALVIEEVTPEEIGVEENPEPQIEEPAVTVAPSEPVVPEPIYLEAIGIAFLEAFDQPEEYPETKDPGFIEATGYGFPSPSATSAIEKRITAMEAAHYRAMANLVEKQSGVNVRREASTENMAFAEEFVEISLSGSLSGVSEVSQTYDTNSAIATVTLQMQREEKPEPIAIPTLAQQRARAEAAARIHATALLREKIGSSFIEHELHIENMSVEHQSAHIHIEGLLQGALFSRARWMDETICEVTAHLEIDPEAQKELSSVSAGKIDPSNDD